MTNLNIELKPVDARKSFYNKCGILQDNNVLFLRSYNTIVCSFDTENEDFKKLWDGYSPTTQRHIDAFCDFVNIKRISKKEWDCMEVQ